jgi:hypothetical protein
VTFDAYFLTFLSTNIAGVSALQRHSPQTKRCHHHHAPPLPHRQLTPASQESAPIVMMLLLPMAMLLLLLLLPPPGGHLRPKLRAAVLGSSLRVR